jgi:hypothetical protein
MTQWLQGYRDALIRAVSPEETEIVAASRVMRCGAVFTGDHRAQNVTELFRDVLDEHVTLRRRGPITDVKDRAARDVPVGQVVRAGHDRHQAQPVHADAVETPPAIFQARTASRPAVVNSPLKWHAPA